MGHEMSGVIESLGAGVAELGWTEGTEVVISPAGFCGRCRWCLTGMQHYCTSGFVIGGDGFERFFNGAFAEYVLAPASTLYRKPADLSFEQVALTEPLGGSWKGMIAYSEMQVGEDVVILGGGSMGLLLTQVASAAGAGRLIVTDIADFKLDYAKRCGATHTLNVAGKDAVAAIQEILPDGPDVVIEAAGTFDAAETAFALCRRGTRVNMFGVIVPGTIPVSPAEMHWKETRVDGSFSVHPRAMLQSLKLQERGLVDTGKIITHRFPLEKIQDALDTMATPERIKVIIEP